MDKKLQKKLHNAVLLIKAKYLNKILHLSKNVKSTTHWDSGYNEPHIESSGDVFKYIFEREICKMQEEIDKIKKNLLIKEKAIKKSNA